MRAEICEVSPRDGLQNEDVPLSTDQKIELIERAIQAGARRIEAVSFVHPVKVPRMADAEEVMAGVPRTDAVRYSGLVLNARGLERAAAAGVDEINVVVVASDTFCRRNQGTSTEQACDIAAQLVAVAKGAGIASTVTIAAAFGCPFEGEVPLSRLRQVISRVVDMGPDELSLADTIGVAVPTEVTERVALARELGGETPLRLHLHDTRHTAVANAVAALVSGVTVFDASIGGIGGCPFAPNATGNVATEDLLYLFNRMQVPTGVNLSAVLETTEWLEQRLGRALPGAILRAGDFPPAQSEHARGTGDPS